MQMSIGLDRLKRFVCLLLIFVLLFCFFMCPRASAVALEATTIAYGGLLVGTILVGAGVVFSSHGDMAKVGAAMYKTMSDGGSAIASKIAAISSWAVEHGKSIGSAALRVGKDLYQEILDIYSSLQSSSIDHLLISSDSVSVPFSSVHSRGETDYSAILDFVSSGSAFMVRFASRDYGDMDYVRYFRIVEISGEKYIELLESDGTLAAKNNISNYTDFPSFSVHESTRWDERGYAVSFEINPIPSQTWTFSAPFVLSRACYVPTPASDLVYPSDNYLVRMPDIPSVDTATGEVTYPDSIAYTKDAVAAPYPIGDDGVKVPDIPFDIPVDQTSGKPMDDTGTDTDTPSKPGEGTDTDKPSVNWPSAGDISLPKLIISKFPFCIPFDVARLIGLLEADPKTPIFHVPLKVGTILDEEIVLDLSQWDNAVRIIRWGELLVFVAGLVLVTRNYIKW